MDIKIALDRVTRNLDLTRAEMRDVMRQIMTGQCTDAQIGGFLVALRMKSEALDEIVAAVEVMRELATPVKLASPLAVDTCGTGGDGSNLFNVSTASAFVIAAAGGKVAKHGNRSVSSSSGSSDLLEAAGIQLNLTPEQIARAIDEIGVGFMFAPNHHSAMKYAIGPRKELGLRTLFNLLGPMTNPAGVKHQVIGVFNEQLCRPLAEVLRELGSEHVLVVHAKDGLDEFSLATSTHIAELKNQEIREYKLTPEEVGLTSHSLVGLEVTTAAESLKLIQQVFNRETSEVVNKACDLICLNAGAALYAANQADSIREGVLLAQDAIASGQAAEKLKALVHFTQALQ